MHIDKRQVIVRLVIAAACRGEYRFVFAAVENAVLPVETLETEPSYQSLHPLWLDRSASPPGWRLEGYEGRRSPEVGTMKAPP